MVNTGESLLNVVTTNKPKVLTGLNQTGCGQEQELQNLLSQTLRHRRKGETYPIYGAQVKRGKPVAFPLGK